jgi:hypothetical protein
MLGAVDPGSMFSLATAVSSNWQIDVLGVLFGLAAIVVAVAQQTLP